MCYNILYMAQNNFLYVMNIFIKLREQIFTFHEHFIDM